MPGKWLFLVVLGDFSKFYRYIVVSSSDPAKLAVLPGPSLAREFRPEEPQLTIPMGFI